MKRITKQMLIALGLSFLLVANSVANNNVIVDLSVLDSLDNNTIITAPSSQKPLFPIVKKQLPIKKKTINKQSIAKKIKKQTKPVVEKQIAVKVKEQPQQIPFVESNEEIVVVDVEPTAMPQQTETLPTQTNAKAIPNTVVEPKTVQQSITSAPTDDIAPVTTQENASTPQLLLNENDVDTAKTNSVLLAFSPDIDVLNAEQQKIIDNAITQFENPIQNKIAIYAYNLDDGVDTFKKKRISLNRAVAVRSYLLPKGYKNFSIKVINIDETSDKANVVELEELKN